MRATPRGLCTVAWYLKPLAGIFTDSAPLFGTRRKHYLIFRGLIAALLYLLVAVVPRAYGPILLAVIAVNCMLVVGSTVTGGLMVEIGQREAKRPFFDRVPESQRFRKKRSLHTRRSSDPHER